MNILILTDFSEIALNAEKYAVHLWQDTPTNFYILNIGVFNKEQGSKHIQLQKKKAIEKLYKNTEEIRQENKNHRFQAIFTEDNVINATRKLVVEKNIDLIVMGATGRDSEQNPILGNHTYELIKKVKCNVLAIPENCDYKQPERIIVPIDYSVSLNNKIFSFLEKHTQIWKPEVKLLELSNSSGNHMNAVGAIENISNQLQYSGVDFQILKDKSLPTEKLISEIQKRFDMIAILGKNLSICNKLLHSKHGLFSSLSNRLPILVLHG